MLIFALFFYLKAYLRYTESLRKKSGGCRVTSFLGNNRQHWPVCAKTISSWVWKVLSVAKHICLWALSGGLLLLQPWQLVSLW